MVKSALIAAVASTVIPGQAQQATRAREVPAPVAHTWGYDRQTAEGLFYEQLLPALSVPFAWTGNVNRCQQGEPSAEYQAATSEAVNYIRRIAGLDTIAFDPVASARAQAAALVMEANGTASHYIDPSWRCYTTTAQQAALTSNLAYGATGPAAILGYMEDSGHVDAGHRRWILDPTSSAMGSGSSPSSNVLTTHYSSNPAASQPEWIPWPPAGWVPDLLEPAGLWSLSSSASGIDFIGAVVTVQDESGAELDVTRYPVVTGLGPATLTWQVGNLEPTTLGDDHTYTVTVSNIGGATPSPSVTYDVSVFSPTRFFEVLQLPEFVSAPQVDKPTSVLAPIWAPTPALTNVSWLANGAIVHRGMNYTPRADEAGATLSVRYRPLAPWYTGGAVTVSAPVPVRLGAAPHLANRLRVRGHPVVGEILTVRRPHWLEDGVATRYQWLRDDVAIGAATGARFRLRAKDRHARITVSIAGRLAGHRTRHISSRPFVPL